jgi:quercetin dioxygenase-like cupin family protein
MSFINLNQFDEIEFFQGYFGRFVHSKNMTLAYVRVKAGAGLPEHSHPHEQICNVIEGDFELTVEGKPYLMKANNTYNIPSNAVHSGRAITECKIIDAFYPVREDFKELR